MVIFPISYVSYNQEKQMVLLESKKINALPQCISSINLNGAVSSHNNRCFKGQVVMYMGQRNNFRNGNNYFLKWRSVK